MMNIIIREEGEGKCPFLSKSPLGAASNLSASEKLQEVGEGRPPHWKTKKAGKITLSGRQRDRFSKQDIKEEELVI